MFDFLKPSPLGGRVAAVPDKKSEQAPAQPLIALQLGANAHWTPRNFSALCHEGFARNPIVYRCVRMITEAAASVTFCVEGDETAQHCLKRAASQSGVTDVFEQFYGYLQLSGEF